MSSVETPFTRLRLPLLSVALTLLLGACAQSPTTPQAAPTVVTTPVPPDTSALLRAPAITPPVAKKVDYSVASPHGGRNDPYYWLRDDTRSKPEVLDHLRAEHAYFEARFAPLQPLNQQLFEEMRARIKEDDASVPTFEDGYWYYTRFAAGMQYPIFVRREGAMESPEEVILDGNERASGKSYYQTASLVVSEDGRIMAVAEDFVGRREYTLRFKDLTTGQWLKDEIADVDDALIFADDNRTVFYVEKDTQTLLPFRVKRHRLVSRWLMR